MQVIDRQFSQPPKHSDNIWNHIVFIYFSILQVIAIGLALLDTPSSNVKDIFMFLMYAFASFIIIAVMLYLYMKKGQTSRLESRVVAYSMQGERVGLYLRFGVILIGMSSLTYVVLSNLSVKTKVKGCLNSGLITVSCIKCLFFVLQAFFILKYHSVIILKHCRLIKFGMYNIILINIMTWEISCLSKISYSGSFLTENANCTESKFKTLHLYFLPAVAEYSVLGIAIFYEILKRIGKDSMIVASLEHKSKSIYGKIKHSIPGIVIGVVVVLICVSCTTAVIVIDKKFHTHNIFIFHNGEEILLYTFSIIILIVLFCEMRKHQYSFSFLHNNIDKNLLYISAFLSIAFSLMIAIYCFTFLTDKIRVVRGITALLEVLQIVIQTAVIEDSFYRCKDPSVMKRHGKPGQNYFAILTGCNFGLWILKSFQMKNGDIFFHKHQVIQNNILFEFFVYATLPLSVLYRYHSSCCFAMAFSKVYKEEVDRLETQMRSKGYDWSTGYHSINNQSSVNSSCRPRSQSQPLIPMIAPGTDEEDIPRLTVPRKALKNFEIARLRILSKQLSCNSENSRLSPDSQPIDYESGNPSSDSDILKSYRLKTMKKTKVFKRIMSNPLESSSTNDYALASLRNSIANISQDPTLAPIYRGIEKVDSKISDDNEISSEKE